MEPKVSVVVVSKNEELRIRQCLQSLLDQEYPRQDYEVIVVDAGSSDGTQQIVHQFPVRLIVDEFGTLGHQRNTGVWESIGVYIAFTDADCVADPRWLARQVKVLDFSSAEVAAVTGPNLMIESDPTLAKTIFYMQQTLVGCGGSPQNYPFMEELLSVISAPNCNAVYRRQVLVDNPYDDGLTCGEDADLNYRLQRKSYRFLYNPQAVVRHHRVSSLSDLARKMFFWGFSMAQIAKKHSRPIRWYFYLPPLMLLYLVALPFLVALGATTWIYSFLLVYAGVVAVTMLQVLFKQRNIYAITIALLLPVQHISYGVGIIWGLVTRHGKIRP